MKKTKEIKIDGASMPLAALKDEDLGALVLQDPAFLSSYENAELLQVAVSDAAVLGRYARRLFDGARLVAVYPGLGENVPAGVSLVGSVLDGSLYISQ